MDKRVYSGSRQNTTPGMAPGPEPRKGNEENDMENNTKSKPNVTIVRDAHGGIWYCDAMVSSSSDLSGEGCVRADEWHYDRMFGG